MNLLLDTNALIWFLYDSPRMAARLKDVIEDDATRCFVSMVSPWEMAIKAQLGKLELGKRLFPDVAHAISRSGFEMLAPAWEDIQVLSKLPMHHRDPFDRMLIAQALRRGYSVMTSDELWDDYGVSRVW